MRTVVLVRDIVCLGRGELSVVGHVSADQDVESLLYMM
jgi:hypothetical protein